ncbi:DegV family protein [Hominifimenecus sp. rT4P-3]|uniref:DegV family protein n=1 Tax=Hominifimenecus sp. rT4P-3 TaxID=3242979 RepID=UPI003DA53B38
MAFRIITDSATDMPMEIREKYHLHVIPTPFIVNGVDYLDGEKMTTQEFYQLLDDDKNVISTYHINEFMFKNAFEPYAKAGDEVLYCCFSTGIAGTFNAANLAKQALLEQYPDFKITIKDCKSASLGFGLIVYKLLKMQENGAPKELIMEAADYFTAHIRHVVTPQTLKYLIKGGRVSKFSGIVGEALDVKPIIVVNKEGALEPISKVRGRKKSLKALVDYVEKNTAPIEGQIVGMCHAGDPEAFEYTKSLLLERMQPKMILTSMIGCAIGAHTGRGLIGIVFMDAEDGKYAEYLK